MTNLSRRDFLKFAGLGMTGAAAAVALTACATEGGTAGTTGTAGTAGTTGTSTGSQGSNAESTTAKVEEIEAIQESANLVDAVLFRTTDAVDTSRKNTLTSGERKDSVNIALGGEITAWTPWQTPQGRNALILNVYEPLFYYLDGYEMVPCMAKSWEDEDDTHFVVEIYDYIKDTDGNNITADDVVAAFDYFANSGNANDFAYYGGVEKVDTYKVRFTWKSPIDSMTSLATMMETCIYSQKAAAEHDFTTDPVGTGAYYLKDMVIGATYTMAANEDYWQSADLRCRMAKQNVNTLNFEVVSDSSMSYIAFEEGQTLSTGLSSTQLPDFLEGGKYFGQFTLVSEMQTGTNGIGFNMSGHSIMADLNMRLAVAYAVDSAGICNALGSNLYYPQMAEAGPTMIGYNSEWDNDTNYYNTYDPDLAKDYLSKTEYKGETLIFLVQSGSDAKMLAAQIIQQSLKAIGVEVEIAAYERAIINTYLFDLEYWDLDFYQWAGDPISQLWGRQNDINNWSTGYSETGIKDDELQAMIEEVQTKSGFTPELIDEIRGYMLDNCLLYSVFGSVSYSAFNECVACGTYAHGHKDPFYGAFEYYLD